MNGKSVGLTIIWWSEAIIALRVLLFSIPVMINKYLAKSFTLVDLNDRFIAVITVTALLYCIVGVVSILGTRHWKVAHYLAAILTLTLTVGSLYAFDQPSATVGLNYFSPIIFATVFTAFTGFLGRKSN